MWHGKTKPLESAHRGQHGKKGDCILAYMQESDCTQKVSPSSGYASAFKKQKSNKKIILMLWGRVGSCAAPSLPYRQRSSVSPPDWSWASPSLALCTGCRKTLPCSQPAPTWVHGTAQARWQRGCALWPALIPPWLWGWRCRNWAPCGDARLGVCRHSQMPVQRKGVNSETKAKLQCSCFSWNALLSKTHSWDALELPSLSTPKLVQVSWTCCCSMDFWKHCICLHHPHHPQHHWWNLFGFNSAKGKLGLFHLALCNLKTSSEHIK